MKTYKLFIAILFCLTITFCDNDNDSLNCAQEIIICSDEYASAPSDPLTINNIELIDNCLLINFSSSGCNGNSWVIKLIDANIVLESYPPQRNLRLSLKNEEMCEAYITKEITFDISKLQTDGDQVILNIENFDTQIIYKY